MSPVTNLASCVESLQIFETSSEHVFSVCSGADLKSNLGLLPVDDGEPLEDEGTHAGSCSSSDGVVDDETLHALLQKSRPHFLVGRK